MWNLHGVGEKKFVHNVWTKMTVMTICGKNLWNLHLRNRMADYLKNLICSIRHCSNNDPWLTLTYFTARPISATWAFVYQSWYLQSAKWFFKYQRSRSFIYLCTGCLRFSIFIFFSSAGLIKTKLHVESLLNGGMKVCSWDLGHMIKKAAMPIYDKTFKTLLLRNRLWSTGQFVFRL